MKQNPARANNLAGPDLDLKLLELMEGASKSISDADLVDSMLRGSAFGISCGILSNIVLDPNSTGL